MKNEKWKIKKALNRDEKINRDEKMKNKKSIFLMKTGVST